MARAEALALAFRGVLFGCHTITAARELADAHFPGTGAARVGTEFLRGLYESCAAACLIELAYGDAGVSGE